MESTYGPWVALLAGGGVVAGLLLLAYGLSGYRSAARFGDTSTSTVGAMAAARPDIDLRPA